MQRIMVIGSPGAGKSTMSRRLAALIGLPLYHLDAEYWLPGWTEREPAEWQAKLARIAGEERWIIDGNYGSSLGVRIARADTVVHLDYSTATCLWRAMRRIVTAFGRIRPDSAEGCPEQFDPAFIAYIAMFRTRKRARMVHLLDGFEGQVIRFTHPPAAERWLGALGGRR